VSEAANRDLEPSRARLALLPVQEMGFGSIPDRSDTFLEQLRAAGASHAMPQLLQSDMIASIDATMLKATLGLPDKDQGGAADRRPWDKRLWLMLPDIREWLAEGLPEQAEEFRVHERTAFVAGLTYQEQQPEGVAGYIRSMDQEERLAFRDLLFWNGIALSPSVRAALRGAPEPSQSPADPDSDDPTTEPVVPFAAVPAVSLPAPAPLTQDETDHWNALCAAFGVDSAPRPPLESANPFLRWLERLSPPSDVASFTRKWLIQNEEFNDINRDLLSARGADEANLTTELAKRLARVQEASRAVMEKSRSAGGWWERLRGSAANKDVTPEEWADSFMDFQNHLVKVFQSIENQINRDRSWLAVADDLGRSATDVDNRWTSWLTHTAQSLNEERVNAVDPSAESKIAWNSRALALESASSAHEHIRSSSTITRILLEKVRQSVDVKERLQQRATMFYWSSLNLFAGLQSVQRTTNSVMEQNELNSLMARSFEAMLTRTSAEEEAQRERLRESFRAMAKSEQSMAAFYDGLSAFQKDTLSLMGDLVVARDSVPVDAVATQTERAQGASAARVLAVPEPDIGSLSVRPSARPSAAAHRTANRP
jgi:hypothetical protein